MPFQNLIDTYLELGLRVPGAWRIEGEGYVGCRSDRPHPICNVVLAWDVSEHVMEELSSLAKEQLNFHLFVPSELGESAERHGLIPRTHLMEMQATGHSKSPAPLEFVTNPRHRLRVARFMAEQFFPNADLAFRELFSISVAAATSFPIAELLDGPRRLGALMLSPGEDCVGVYNLCVREDARGTGIGRELVNWSLVQAESRNLPLVLQCEPALSDWYRCQGFIQVANFLTFCSPIPDMPDIIDIITVH